MIGFNADVTKILYNKFEPQGHVATTLKKHNTLIHIIVHIRI